MCVNGSDLGEMHTVHLLLRQLWCAVHRGEWEKIGTVVGAPGDDTVAAGNQFHEGQQYDFVFDVDVADGVPPLKLPVNKGDNPYIAADK